MQQGVVDCDEDRPAFPGNRSVCRTGPRPCPWAGCRYHLEFHVTEVGTLYRHHPDQELEDLPDTCALDVADRHIGQGITLGDVGNYLNITRERTRQIERDALAKLRSDPAVAGWLELWSGWESDREDAVTPRGGPSV